ncbi:MAG: hypothetical protein U0796_17750 [Gemmatales bacterium]
MPSQKIVRICLAWFVVGLSFPNDCAALDFTICVHPKMGLNADKVKAILVASLTHKRSKEVDLLFGQNILHANVKDTVDLKTVDDRTGLVLFFEGATTIPLTKSIVGSLNGAPERKHQYLSLFSLQPYSFWFRAKPHDKLQFLGKGILWGEASQLQDKKGESNSSQLVFSLSRETSTDLHARAASIALKEFKNIYAQSLSHLIFTSKGNVNVNADWLINTYKTPYDAMSHIYGTRRPLPPELSEYRVSYPFTKITKTPNGDYEYRIDIKNNMPFTVHGMLTRVPSQLEVRQAKRSVGEQSAVFDIDVGQSKTIALTIPGNELSREMLNNCRFTLEWLEPGGRKADSEEQTGRKKRKK